MNLKKILITSLYLLWLTDVFAVSKDINNHINNIPPNNQQQRIDSNIIKKIVVSGNKKILKSTILKHMNVKKNAYFSSQLEKQMLENLYQTKFFKEIDINFNNNTIYVKVKENYLVYKITINGNDIIKQEDIKKNILLKEGEYFDKYKIFKDMRTIYAMYLSNSILESKVNYKILPHKKNPCYVEVIYNITEGTTPKTSKVVFVGNESIIQEEFDNILSTPSPNYLITSIFAKNNLSMEGIQIDNSNLENLYKSHSYAQVKIQSYILQKDKKWFVIHSIDEGAKYLFGTTKINFDFTSHDITEEDLLKQITISYGDAFNINEIQQSENNIIEFLHKKKIDVLTSHDIIPDEMNNVLDIKLTIQTLPKKYINNINISENYQLEDIEIRKNFLLHEGDIMNSSLYSKSAEKASSTGYHVEIKSQVNKFSVSNMSSFFKDIFITEIAKTRSHASPQESASAGGLSLALSMATEGLGTTLRLTEPHFLGKALLLDMMFYWGTAVNNYKVSFIRDNFLTHNTQLGLSFESKTTKNSHNDPGKHISSASRDSYNYNEQSFGNKLFLGTTKDQTTIIYSVFSNIKQIDILNKEYFLQKDEGNFYENGTDIKIIYRKLKNAYAPTNPLLQEGFMVTGNLFGTFPYENTGYVGGETKIFYAHRFSHFLLFKTDVSFGIKAALPGKEIKVFQRYNLGDKTMRGFKEEGIGPVLIPKSDSEKKIHVGGNYMYKISTELLLNLDFTNKNLFSIIPFGFVDIGSVWGINKKNIHPELFDRYYTRISCGIGVRMLLPVVGSIEFGYGKPLLFDEKCDALHSFHFALGANLVR